MTDYRAELEARGFQVARLPFRPNRHHCRGADGRNASIDLATGELWIWGTLERSTWPAWAGGRETEPSGASLPPGDFLQECVAFGFELVGEPEPATGNVWARYQGEQWLLLTGVRRILGVGFREFSIGLDGQADPVPAIAEPTRSFVSMREAPVMVTGASKQQGLF